jgi:putative two-component system response regulator
MGGLTTVCTATCHMARTHTMNLDCSIKCNGSLRQGMNADTIKILVVDDDNTVCQLLVELLSMESYQCHSADSAEMAIKRLEQNAYDLVLSDILMDGMSGVDLLKVTKDRFPDVAMIMVTGLEDRDTALQALNLGAYGYLIKPLDRNDLIISVANALERRRLTLLSQQYNRELEEEVQERTREVRAREEEVVLRLISAMGYRDNETGTHTKRIGLYAAALAQELGWDASDVEDIKLAAPMHDVGKIGIPDTILLKPGSLTSEEFLIMKRHTEIGAKILEGSLAPMIQMAKDIALSHHERWDGSGYPHGLANDHIPKSASIVGIVDVYDALVHDRVYRPAFTEDKALSILNEEYEAGKYDPEIFSCFINLLPEMMRIRNLTKEDEASIGDFTANS